MTNKYIIYLACNTVLAMSIYASPDNQDEAINTAPLRGSYGEYILAVMKAEDKTQKLNGGSWLTTLLNGDMFFPSPDPLVPGPLKSRL